MGSIPITRSISFLFPDSHVRCVTGVSRFGAEAFRAFCLMALILRDGDGGELRLEAGGLAVLSGGIGAGKSLWLRRLAGLEPMPAGAAVMLDGAPPPFPPMRVFLREDRRPPIWLAPTLGEEVAFGLPEAARARLDDALARWELAGLGRDARLAGLNRAQALRAFLAAADLAGARLVLLDEPLAGFPQDEAARMARRIAAWAGEGAGRVVVAVANRWQDWAGVAGLRRWRVIAPDAMPVLEDA